MCGKSWREVDYIDLSFDVLAQKRSRGNVLDSVAVAEGARRGGHESAYDTCDIQDRLTF